MQQPAGNGMPSGIGVIDTMIGFPDRDFGVYDFIRDQLKDDESTDFEFPVEYMFKNVPKELYGADANPIEVTLGEMDRFGIEYGLIGAEGERSRQALRDHPDRFFGMANVDPNDVMGEVRKIRRLKDEWDIRAVGTFPVGCNPQVAIDSPLYYPIYSTCCELDIPIFVCAGVPGPRLPMSPQLVERIDQVMYDFPELTFVTRHGCEPWEDLIGEADAQVARPPLLHVGVRAEALPEGDHRLRQHPRRRQDHLRRLLPDGPVARAHHERHATRRSEGRRLAEVPTRQRRPDPEDRLTRIASSIARIGRRGHECRVADGTAATRRLGVR